MRSTDSSARSGFAAAYETIERRSGTLEIGRRDQRQGDRLRQPDSDERVGDQPSLALARRQQADLAVRVGQRAADAVEADPARDLLDQVDLALQVGTERGHRCKQCVRSPSFARSSSARSSSIPSGASAAHTSSASRSVPSTRVHSARAHANARALDRGRVHVDGIRRDVGARDLRQELHGPLGVDRDRIGVDPPLEAGARLTAQLEPLRRTGDAEAIEVGRLEQDLGGGVGDLGGGSPHDPGDGMRRCARRRRSAGLRH